MREGLIYSKIRIHQTVGRAVEVEADGNKLEGVRSAKFHLSAGEIPTVELELMAKDVELDLPNVKAFEIPRNYLYDKVD